MRILCTPHIEHYTIGLYSEIAKKNSVSLLTESVFDIPIKQIKILRIPKFKVLHKRIMYACLRAYDVIHANTSYDGSLFSKSDILVVIEHGYPNLEIVEPHELAYYRKEIKALLDLSAHGIPIVGISDFAARMLHEKYSVKVAKVIYHGIMDIFEGHKKATINHPPVILFNSRLVKAKEPFVLLEACRSLTHEMDFELHIRGDEPLMREIFRYCKHNLNGKVKFLPRLPFKSMPDVYKKSDIFVHTASKESFGMVILEAMASGLPVIVPASGGAFEVAGDNCISFEPDNPDDLCDKILKLFNDPRQYRKQSERSLLRSKFFTWRKAAKEYLDLFSHIQ